MERDNITSYCYWLTRAHFSRAISHRSGTLATSFDPDGLHVKAKILPHLLGPGSTAIGDFLLSQAGITRKSRTDSMRSRWKDSAEFVDSDLEQKVAFSFPLTKNLNHSSMAFSDCSSPVTDEESTSAGSSMASSPSSSSCFSRTGSDGSESHGKYSTEGYENEGHKPDVKQAASWSDLFRHSGGERAVPLAEKWMIDLSQLYLGKRFACGSYSRLYLGIYKDEAVAVKVVKQADEIEVLSSRLERLFTQEITLHSSLEHPNIVKFVGACKKPPALCMLTEYLSGGTLRSFLRKANDPLPLKQLLGMALDIAAGMNYLHARCLMHRDLKSDNLLLTDDLRIKIADFGVACYESNWESMRDNPGTYRWMAPEMISQKPCTRKVDVFSFGIVLYELVSRCVPFEEMTAAQAAFAIVYKNARPEIPSHCPPLLRRLICQCWSTDHKERPEFQNIMEILQKVAETLMV